MATENVRQLPQSHNSSSELIVPRHGVVTLFGYGIQVRVDRGHLLLEDGIGPNRRHARLPRVNHNLRRVIVIGSDGFATFDAIRWVSDVGASLVFLDRRGKVLFVSGPAAAIDSRLRRALALALSNGVGLEISRTLIRAKLEAQERVLHEQLTDSLAAQTVAQFREKLTTADTFDKVRILEAHAAAAYFGAWHSIPVFWPKQELNKIPDHWRTAGSRRSPLSGGPRLAVTPVQAILNYSFALLESETRICISALGLDATMGLGLHTDAPSRDSLVFDVLEPVRAEVESWVLSWIMREHLRKSDFFETPTGNCRLMSSFCTKLSQTAPTWRKLVAPWVEYVASMLWGKSQPKARRLPTPLTQQHRREAKGQPSFPTITAPRPDRLCRGCGKQLKDRDKKLCKECWVLATQENFDAGRNATRTPEALAKRAATQRARRETMAKWNPSDLPAWLTREVYIARVVPALRSVTKSQIRSMLGVSEPYASYIQSGTRIPHPRFWQELATLVGIAAEMQGQLGQSN